MIMKAGLLTKGHSEGLRTEMLGLCRRDGAEFFLKWVNIESEQIQQLLYGYS
jgi:hypothetical protein